MQKTLASISVLVAFIFTGPAQAQSTVAEVLEKGGKQLSKAEFLEMLPARLQQQWPNRQGEEELVLTADGALKTEAESRVFKANAFSKM